MRFRPNEAMLKDIKPVLKEKAKRFLSDSLQQIFIEAINTDKLQIDKFTKNCDNLTNTIFNKEYIMDSLLTLTVKEKT